MNKKTIKKKVAPKKSAKRVAKDTAPLKRFRHYDISRTKDLVKFGCGDVTVRRSDLIAYAKIKRAPELVKGMRALTRLQTAANNDPFAYGEILNVSSLSAETLLRIAGN